MRESGTHRLPRVAAVILLAALAAVGLLTAASCGGGTDTKGSLTASGQRVDRTFDLQGFTAVHLDGGIQAAVVRDDSYAVQVSLDDNIMEHVVVKVDGDTLWIGLDPAYTYSGQTFRAGIAMPKLAGLESSGASMTRLIGFTSQDPMSITLSGGSRATLSGVQAGDVTLDASGNSGLAGELKATSLAGTLSGASRVGVSGSASSATLEASGASNFELPAFVLKTAHVKLSGGSLAALDVTGSLSADVSGGSKLGYSGSPELGEMTTSGGGQVTSTGP